jgi:hypothetical protein
VNSRVSQTGKEAALNLGFRPANAESQAAKAAGNFGGIEISSPDLLITAFNPSEVKFSEPKMETTH